MARTYVPVITDHELRKAAIKYEQIRYAGLDRELREEVARRTVDVENLDHCMIGRRLECLRIARELAHLLGLPEERCECVVEDALLRTRGRIVLECIDEFERLAKVEISKQKSAQDNMRNGQNR